MHAAELILAPIRLLPRDPDAGRHALGAGRAVRGPGTGSAKGKEESRRQGGRFPNPDQLLHPLPPRQRR